MILYSFILLIIIFGIYYFDSKSLNNKQGNILYIFLCIIMILSMGFPDDNMGTDLISYRESFASLPSLENLSFEDLEIGGQAQPFWLYFNAIINYFGNSDFTTFKLIHSFVINSIIFLFIKRFCKFKFSVILLYFLSFNYFYFNLDILRESLAVCVFLLSWRYLIKRKYIVYYIYCIIAFLFHASAIFTFLLPFFFKCTEIKNSWLFYSFIIIVTIIAWNLTQYIELLSSFTYLVGVVDQFEYYNELPANLINIVIVKIFSSIPVVLFIYCSKYKRESKNPYLQLAYFMFILLICEPGIIGLSRLQNYIIIPYFIFLINTWYSRKQFSSKIMIFAFLLIGFLQVYHYRQGNEEGPSYYERYVPYRSKF